MTACDNFEPCFDWPACDDECFGCANCMGHPDDHQTARPADSDGQPGPSGAPDVPQGAPLQTPQGDCVEGVTEGNAVDAEGWQALAPASAAPDLHGAASPTGAAADRPDQDNAPLVWAPHASPVDLSPAPEPTGLATSDGWARAIELAAHVARLSALLELTLDRLAEHEIVLVGLNQPSREAITKAREATS